MWLSPSDYTWDFAIFPFSSGKAAPEAHTSTKPSQTQGLLCHWLTQKILAILKGRDQNSKESINYGLNLASKEIKSFLFIPCCGDQQPRQTAAAGFDILWLFLSSEPPTSFQKWGQINSTSTYLTRANSSQTNGNSRDRMHPEWPWLCVARLSRNREEQTRQLASAEVCRPGPCGIHAVQTGPRPDWGQATNEPSSTSPFLHIASPSAETKKRNRGDSQEGQATYTAWRPCLAMLQCRPPAGLALRLLTEETSIWEGHCENSSGLPWTMPHLRLTNTLLLTPPSAPHRQPKDATLP